MESNVAPWEVLVVFLFDQQHYDYYYVGQGSRGPQTTKSLRIVTEAFKSTRRV